MKTLPLTFIIALMLAGCASYQALPLDEQPHWVDDLAHLPADASTLNLPALPPHPFAPGADGLDMTDLAILAVFNNPDLRLARDDAGIAHAQAFSASLLPDPQLAASADFKLHPDAGSSRGFSIGPSYDFGSLLTHGTVQRAAGHDADKADLNVLWQEWQVITQARLLYVRLVEGRRLLAALQSQHDVLTPRITQIQQALQQQLLTLDVANTAGSALRDVDKQIADVQRQQNQARQDLNALLGLAPAVAVPLKPQVDLAPIDQRALQALLPQLPARRPDLLALKSAYLAQDDRYRAAIIAQFPAFTLGLTRTRDTGNVASRGFNVAFSLPLFNRNRGNIAIEKATRQRLHDEYQLRINTAYRDIDRLSAEQILDADQLSQARQGLRQLEQQRAASEQAFQARNLDTLALINLNNAVLAKQSETIGIEQAMLEQRVALLSIIGGELPVTFTEHRHHE